MHFGHVTYVEQANRSTGRLLSGLKAPLAAETNARAVCNTMSVEVAVNIRHDLDV